MTPQDALAAALRDAGPDLKGWMYGANLNSGDAAAILAALPAGWRLTDEPEVTVEALAAALASTPVPLMNYRTYQEAAAVLLLALGATPSPPVLPDDRDSRTDALRGAS